MTLQNDIFDSWITDYEWANSVNTTGSELFEVRQSFGDDRPGNYALIAQYWPDQQAYYTIRRIYPGNDRVLIDLPIPELFREQGLTQRYIALKMSQFYRSTNVTPWTITLRELYSEP